MNKELNKTAKSFYELIKAINNLKTENMKFKGQLKGFPKEVVNKMLERQVEQGNELNKFVYENENIAGRSDKGFTWQNTIEGHEFWSNVINKKDFDLFFQKYPKEHPYYNVDVIEEGVIITPPEDHEVDEKNSTFKHIKFKKKERVLPKSWEEFEEIIGISSYLGYMYDRLNTGFGEYLKFWGATIPKKYVALRKLELLRDYYNDGWVPDWKDGSSKFSILKFENEASKRIEIYTNYVLTFEKEFVRDEFYNNFKGLIEEAGDLI